MYEKVTWNENFFWQICLENKILFPKIHLFYNKYTKNYVVDAEISADHFVLQTCIDHVTISFQWCADPNRAKNN